jgi:hypothetical protein
MASLSFLVILPIRSRRQENSMKAILTVLLFGTGLLNAQAVAARSVHRVYVAELHFPKNPDYDGIVRSKLVGSLARYCGSACTVVEAVGPSDNNGPDIADGILIGTVVVQTSDNRRYVVQGAMRLVDKDGNVLWADTVYSSPFARSATSSFAENTAKKLASFLTR